MTIKTIITEPNEILRQVSKPVIRVGDDERKLMDDMLETMYAANGIGLAAIQIDKIDELSQYKSELNSEIDKMIENKESGMILLKLVEIIGEKELNELNSRSLNFIVEIMNRTKLIGLGNELLLEILPLKV